MIYPPVSLREHGVYMAESENQSTFSPYVLVLKGRKPSNLKVSIFRHAPTPKSPTHKYSISVSIQNPFFKPESLICLYTNPHDTCAQPSNQFVDPWDILGPFSHVEKWVHP